VGLFYSGKMEIIFLDLGLTQESHAHSDMMYDDLGLCDEDPSPCLFLVRVDTAERHRATVILRLYLLLSHLAPRACTIHYPWVLLFR